MMASAAPRVGWMGLLWGHGVDWRSQIMADGQEEGLTFGVRRLLSVIHVMLIPQIVKKKNLQTLRPMSLSPCGIVCVASGPSFDPRVCLAFRCEGPTQGPTQGHSFIKTQNLASPSHPAFQLLMTPTTKEQYSPPFPRDRDSLFEMQNISRFYFVH